MWKEEDIAQKERKKRRETERGRDAILLLGVSILYPRTSDTLSQSPF